jgi:uncharacterized protein (DUF2062 family)
MELLQVPVNRKRGIHASKRANTMGSAVQEALYPSMGYRALCRWLLLKIIRQTQDEHKVALGAAIGMWVNFLPLPGLGGLSSIGLAWALRANIPAAFIAQWPSNPWTFPLIWWVSYVFGRLIIPMPEGSISFGTLMHNFSWNYLGENWLALMQGVMLPMTVGGQVLGIVLGIITYRIMYRQVGLFWDRRRARHAALAAAQG